MINNIIGELAFYSFMFTNSVEDVANMCYEEILNDVQTIRALRGDSFIQTDNVLVELIYNYARRTTRRNYMNAKNWSKNT